MRPKKSGPLRPARPSAPLGSHAHVAVRVDDTRKLPGHIDRRRTSRLDHRTMHPSPEPSSPATRDRPTSRRVAGRADGIRNIREYAHITKIKTHLKKRTCARARTCAWIRGQSGGPRCQTAVRTRAESRPRGERGIATERRAAMLSNRERAAPLASSLTCPRETPFLFESFLSAFPRPVRLYFLPPPTHPNPTQPRDSIGGSLARPVCLVSRGLASGQRACTAYRRSRDASGADRSRARGPC